MQNGVLLTLERRSTYAQRGQNEALMQNGVLLTLERRYNLRSTLVIFYFGIAKIKNCRLFGVGWAYVGVSANFRFA